MNPQAGWCKIAEDTAVENLNESGLTENLFQSLVKYVSFQKHVISNTYIESNISIIYKQCMKKNYINH